MLGVSVCLSVCVLDILPGPEGEAVSCMEQTWCCRWLSILHSSVCTQTQQAPPVILWPPAGGTNCVHKQVCCKTLKVNGITNGGSCTVRKCEIMWEAGDKEVMWRPRRNNGANKVVAHVTDKINLCSLLIRKCTACVPVFRFQRGFSSWCVCLSFSSQD